MSESLVYLTKVSLSGHAEQTMARRIRLLQFNPIPAEVLENQDMLGGGQFDPPL